MKIGLLTYYGDLNCGTNMQAYATFQALKKAYPSDDVEIIPFHGFKPSIRPYKTFSLKNIINDVKRIRKYSKFVKEQLLVKNDVIIKDVEAALEYINSRKYDVIYVGADTLLELDRVSGNCISAYWLKDVNAKKVLIAASAKNVVFEKLTEKQQADLKIAASQFSHIGIRDRVTKSLFERLVENKNLIEYIPDPTFTYNIDYSYIDSYLKQKKISIPEKSVFVQFYGDDHWLDDVAKDLKKRGYTMITNRGIWWSDIVLIDMSPLEQVGLYKYVSFVITHRFHDGVFCMKNHTPALIYVKSGKESMTENGESKHVSLLKDFGLYPQAFLGALDSEEGLADVWQSFQNVKNVFDEEKVEEILQKNKKTYLEYLEETIK
ncbi:MAG: polysaccharide pyruvyl transferase family protein [Aeriscardovia sp.]|nr:polysaccharide pyruvyl transferase family protein [Aeriscardovia sp.]